MADLPEVSEFTEGVRAFESTDPARYDVLNNALQPLVNRTKWLKDNMGQGGGSQGTPVEWIVGDEEPATIVPISRLTPGTMYILDTRIGPPIGINVSHSESIPVGSEFHFVCAGDPTHVTILEGEGGSNMTIITAAGLADMNSYLAPFNKNGSVVTLKKISETDWLLFGDIAEGDSEGFPSLLTCQWNLIGDECDGWWYVGDKEFGGVYYKILIGGEEYERGDLQWKTEQTATPGTYVFDGVLATNAMMENPSLHPAAEYCVSLGNGSYMPSIGEIQLVYTNREVLGGMNLSGNYWSSTQSQFDSTTVGRENARYLNYTTGSITENYSKTSTLKVRPARRIPILEEN